MNKDKLKSENIANSKPVLAKVPTCNHFWKMVTKDYYKCSFCDSKYYR